MSSATNEIRPTLSLSIAIACGLCLAHTAAAAEEGLNHPAQGSDEAFLQSVQPIESAAQAKPPIGAFFANIIETREEIEFLVGHKRYEDLIKVVESFRKTLDQAGTILPENERRRAARFTAASRSLGQLSKAVHSFMWNGQDEQLFGATDKLQQLLDHIETLISPEELAQAHAFRESAKG